MVTKPNPDVLIDVTSRHHQVSEGTREYAANKASKLLRFHNRISRIQLVMDRLKDVCEVEIIVHVDNGHTFVARETATKIKAALDPLLTKMERQLKKDNERRKRHKGSQNRRNHLPEERLAGSVGDEESYDDVVRRKMGT